MSTFSPEDTRLLSALDILAADARGTDAARERLVVALGMSRAAASRLALAPVADASVLCLDQDCGPEAYSFEEAREAATRRPRQDLLAAGLEQPAKKPSKKAKRSDDAK